ncbi:MAG: glutathione-disulfide reductase [Alphaproteobacteria bacterium]
MADFDLIVLGGGSGGVACARRAASHGAKVLLIEADRLGGTCVNRGCIPKKLFVYAAHFRDDFEDARGYGWTLGEARFDWPTLKANKDKEIARLNGVYAGLLEKSGVTRIEGWGRLVGADAIEVGGKTYRGTTILIATGGRPVRPEIPGAELGVVSDDMFELEALPKRAVVVGGGYIGCEFAGILNGLGVETTLVHRGDALLRGFDDDLRELLGEEIEKHGVKLRLNTDLVRLTKKAGAIVAEASQGDAIETDLVLFATGRAPNTGGIGLEEAGVELNHAGAVEVDEWSRSTVPSIYAIGDCTDRINLTPVAIHEGRCLAETLYNDNPMMPDHRDVPTAVFSQPEIGTVGLSEEDARRVHRACHVFKTRFRPLRHTLSGRDEKVFMKLVVDRESDRVVGCHMIGAGAGELVQLLGVAIKCGATKAQFDATIAVHPTSAEEFVTMYQPAAPPSRKAAE